MGKKISIFFFTIIVLSAQIKADEGMWLLSLLDKNYEQMKKQGLKLTVSDIYDINKSSLKDAIVKFGNGCTGEIVSADGLVFTNHHCGYGQIQSHSTVENDILTNGFWAKTKTEELACKGLTVKRLIKMEDVSNQIIPIIDTINHTKRKTEKLKELTKNIIDKAVEGTHYVGELKSMFDGNQYFVFLYEEYKDIRLVGAPPANIGKFGGDEDNWMWPRHTGDFAIFRIYTAPDGKPAEYDKNNIPLKPKKHLRISLKGVKEGDFAMIIGFPGTTDRYKTSIGIKQTIEILDPIFVNVRTEKLNILKKHMQSSDHIRIKYSNKYQGTSNYWKYYQGEILQVKKNNVINKKRAQEEAFLIWVSQDIQRKKEYENAIINITTYTKALEKYNKNMLFYKECIERGNDVLSFANNFKTLERLLKDNDTTATEIQKLTKNQASYFKDLDINVDIELLTKMLEIYAKNVDTDFYPRFFSQARYKKSPLKYITNAYQNSIFKDSTSMLSFLNQPSYKKLIKDPIYSIYKDFVAVAQNTLTAEIIETQQKLADSYKIYVKGMLEMQKNKPLAPNANGSIRLTYGNVKSYSPRDAVHYNYYTTIKGIMEKKEETKDKTHHYYVEEKLETLYNKKNYGTYAKANEELVTCFLTTNDITGGNSGSPVLDGNGHLIGIAFDGNWEAMSGNIYFDETLKRTIVVDVRYVLFIIDKFANANNLMQELDILP